MASVFVEMNDPAGNDLLVRSVIAGVGARGSVLVENPQTMSGGFVKFRVDFDDIATYNEAVAVVRGLLEGVPGAAEVASLSYMP